MNEIGACGAVFGDLPLEEALDRLAALGFDLIDLPTDSPFRMMREWCAGSLSGPAIRTMLDERGIRVGCVSNSRDTLLLLGPFGPHTDPVLAGSPEEKRRHAEESARRTIALAAELAAPLVRLAFGCPDYARWLTWVGSEVSWRDNIQEFASEANQFIKEARASQLRICIETHPKQVVFDFGSTLIFLDEMQEDLDVLALCVDPANLATVGCKPEPFLRSMAPHIGCVHVKDLEIWGGGGLPPEGTGWTRYGPQPPIRFRALGWGGLDWRAFVTVLSESGYEGTYFVEHEDVLVRRDEGLRAARQQLAELVRSAGTSNRTW